MSPEQVHDLLCGGLLAGGIALFCSLTLFRNSPVLHDFAIAALSEVGWAAYPLSIEITIISALLLIERRGTRRLVRWTRVTGFTLIICMALIASHALLGMFGQGIATGGEAGSLLTAPISGWSPWISTPLVFFLTALGIAMTINWRHTLGALRLILGIIVAIRLFVQRPRSSAQVKSASPFLGQRPRYSRYGPPAGVEDESTVESALLAESGKDETPQTETRKLPLWSAISLFPRKRASSEEVADQENGTPDEQHQLLLHEDTQDGTLEAVEIDSNKQTEALEPLTTSKQGATPEHRPRTRLRTSQSALAPSSTDASLSDWIIPSLDLLEPAESLKSLKQTEDASDLAKAVNEALRSFSVLAEVREDEITFGPTVIRIPIHPTGKPEMIQDEKSGKMVPARDASGNIIYETRTRTSRIMALQNDLALILAAKTVRMEAPVPGHNYVGLEIPNKNSRLVTLREVLESKEYQAAKGKSKLTIALGKDVAGAVRVGDLARMPHLLIAGATGAGKSVEINDIICSIITQATPDDVRLLMIDPKMVELNMYNGIPHLLSPVVTEVDRVVPLLKNAITEMERRYRLFSKLSVRNLDGYRKLREEKRAAGDTSLQGLPAIVIIIDELADLMMAAPEEVEGMICRLAQLARATGIHLVIATQRPSVDVITGLIKANIPTRISFMVSSQVDSRTIIDMGGAERLLGRGDMLYLPADAGKPERMQACFLGDTEVEKLVNYWCEQAMQRVSPLAGEEREVSTPAIEPGWEVSEGHDESAEPEDDLLDRAEEIVREAGRASVSLLQRRLRVGYSRAGRLIDQLVERGVIQPGSEGGPRGRPIIEQDTTDTNSENTQIHDLNRESVGNGQREE